MRRVALVIALAACGGDSPTGNSGMSGTFDLSTVDGQSLPYLVGVSSSQDTQYIASGTIRVLSRGRVSVEQGRLWHTTTGGRPEDTDTAVVTYRENGTTLLIEYATYSDTGTLAGSTLTVKTLVNLGQGNVFHRNLLYYRR